MWLGWRNEVQPGFVFLCTNPCTSLPFWAGYLLTHGCSIKHLWIVKLTGVTGRPSWSLMRWDQIVQFTVPSSMLTFLQRLHSQLMHTLTRLPISNKSFQTVALIGTPCISTLGIWITANKLCPCSSSHQVTFIHIQTCLTVPIVSSYTWARIRSQCIKARCHGMTHRALQTFIDINTGQPASRKAVFTFASKRSDSVVTRGVGMTRIVQAFIHVQTQLPISGKPCPTRTLETSENVRAHRIGITIISLKRALV